MADKAPIIVIKKIQGGHGGGHGGAWKVAYADFVTAMMCFFLVMWLMGSDEETQQVVAQTFQAESSASSSSESEIELGIPSGKRINAGQNSVLQGMGGEFPEDLVERPSFVQDQNYQENLELSELAEEIFEGQVYGVDVSIESMRFSLPDEIIFKPNSIEFAKNAVNYLERLGQLFKSYPGYINIESHTDQQALQGTQYDNVYEYSLAKSVMIMNYMVDARFVPESKLFPAGSGARRKIASDDSETARRLNRRIEFTLSRKSN